MYDFLITTSKGFEALLADEVNEILPGVEIKTKPGQVLFHGELSQAYRLCMWSRLANRVLLKLAQAEINNAEDLYQLAAGVNWSSHMDVTTSFVVDFIGTNKQINNSQFGALKVKDALVDHFNDLYEQRPQVSKAAPDMRIHCRLWRQDLAIYLDLSGESLHKRYYREHTGKAPLKEHLAVAMLMRSGWKQNQQQPLIDPMCGSGTLIIEAALIASNIAPGSKRQYWGFLHWKKHEPDTWSQIVEDAAQQQTQPECRLFANDIDKRMINLARSNADNAGVMQNIQFSNMDASKLKCPITHKGYIVSNPPYGERLGELTSLLPMFRLWGAQLKQDYQDWQLSLLTSNRDMLRELKLVAHKEYQLMNGNLACQLVNFQLDEKNCQVREGKQQVQNDFANRLGKNLNRLKKWLKQQNTNCYRVYDADLPEYNVAVDRYADWVVVQEYAAPKDIPEQKAKRRLHEILISIPAVMDVAPDKVVLKVRAQQKGKQQYEKLNQKQEFLEVYENGARLWVNLKDYLDTGLFLDHRITRQKVQQLSRDKHVLNLFAYTGSVSVHAALGKAKSVTTVDMSNTYLDWAKRNFSLNNLKGPYEFVQANCLAWLAEHQQQYDLIFIDPPSFSNSKRMQSTWDVQRDHVKLISDAKRCLSAGGKIIFSNNLRQFKLEQGQVEELGLKVEHISQQTLPEDFKRNPKIHHCWILTDAD